MKNKSVSDFVASTMDAVLNSPEHKSLFGTQYKYASDENSAKDKKSKRKKCSTCKCYEDECECGDMSYADDDEYGDDEPGSLFDPRSSTEVSFDPGLSKYVLEERDMDDPDDFSGFHLQQDLKEMKRPRGFPKGMRPNQENLDTYNELHGTNYTVKDFPIEEYDYEDEPFVDEDEDSLSSTAFSRAIKGLLTASAALDKVNMANSSAVSLKLASLIVQAKKVKDQEEKKSKNKKKKNKKLTSADFKKMHKEDDDGKLTSANFKKMLADKKKSK